MYIAKSFLEKKFTFIGGSRPYACLWLVTTSHHSSVLHPRYWTIVGNDTFLFHAVGAILTCLTKASLPLIYHYAYCARSRKLAY
jgi:hypothetical protein